MVSKVNNSDSFFRSTSGLHPETESTKAYGKSENSLITEFGMPAEVADNPQQQARYKDQWSKAGEQYIEPTKIEFPNIVFEKKK